MQIVGRGGPRGQTLPEVFFNGAIPNRVLSPSVLLLQRFNFFGFIFGGSM